MESHTSLGRLIASKTDLATFEQIVQTSISKSKYNGKVYVNLTDGSLSSKKTDGAARVPLAVLQEAFIELMTKAGHGSSEIKASQTWQNLPNAASQKKSFTEVFKSSVDINKAEDKNQKKLMDKLEEGHRKVVEKQIMEAPVHMIGAVKHSKLQHVGGDGKALDPVNYGKEMYTISNKMLIRDSNGLPKLDANGNQQYKPIPGIPEELHVYKNVLDNTYKEWAQQLNQPNAIPRFDEYIQKKLIDKKDMRFNAAIKKNTVKYLDDTELAKTKVTFGKGKEILQVGLKSISDSPKKVTEDSNSYAFVMGKNSFDPKDTSSSLYMAVKTESPEGRINHSSFFRGGKVQAAGLFTLSNGKITEIMPSSGHYKPDDPELAASLKYLKSNLSSEDFNNIDVIGIDNKVQSKANQWLEAYESRQEDKV